VLAEVNAQVLQRLLLDWQRRLAGPIQDSLVIVDGKKMRHGGVEMVNAINGQGQYLGGVITQTKSDEIPAARQLLKTLDLLNKIVLSDALHTQVETGQQILFEQGGDFLLTVQRQSTHPPNDSATPVRTTGFFPHGLRRGVECSSASTIGGDWKFVFCRFWK